MFRSSACRGNVLVRALLFGLVERQELPDQLLLEEAPVLVAELVEEPARLLQQQHA